MQEWVALWFWSSIVQKLTASLRLYRKPVWFHSFYFLKGGGFFLPTFHFVPNLLNVGWKPNTVPRNMGWRLFEKNCVRISFEDIVPSLRLPAGMRQRQTQDLVLRGSFHAVNCLQYCRVFILHYAFKLWSLSSWNSVSVNWTGMCNANVHPPFFPSVVYWQQLKSSLKIYLRAKTIDLGRTLWKLLFGLSVENTC